MATLEAFCDSTSFNLSPSPSRLFYISLLSIFRARDFSYYQPHLLQDVSVSLPYSLGGLYCMSVNSWMVGHLQGIWHRVPA